MMRVVRTIDLKSQLIFAMTLLMFSSFAFTRQAEAQGISQEQLRYFQNRRGVSMLLLSTREIRRELDVSREQRRMVDALADDIRAQRNRRESVSPKLIRVVLNEEHNKRLAQLRLQFEGAYAIDDTDFAKDVELTAEQRDAVEELRKKAIVTDIADIKDAIGEEPFSKWSKRTGDAYEFSGSLATIREEYLKGRQFFDLYPRRGRGRR